MLKKHSGKLVWSQDEQVLDGIIAGKQFHVKGRSGWEGVYGKGHYRWTDKAGTMAALKSGQYYLVEGRDGKSIAAPTEPKRTLTCDNVIIPRKQWSTQVFDDSSVEPPEGTSSFYRAYYGWANVLLLVEFDFSNLISAVKKLGDGKIELLVK